MAEKFSPFDPADYLETEEDIAAFLQACAAEDPGDGSVMLRALGAVTRARNMSDLARRAGMSREGLYKALSGEGNPSFATVLKVMRALGLKLTPEAA